MNWIKLLMSRKNRLIENINHRKNPVKNGAYKNKYGFVYPR